MVKTKIIAMYLPQYHQIPENDEFWGKGFTDWVTVKNAKPLFKGHKQPRVPLNNNYYDLSLKENVAWQAKLAKEHGIYGFGIYHYWFNNEKNLLTKPAEIILVNKDIDINFHFAWDNTNWKRSWENVERGNDWAPVIDNSLKNRSHSPILIPYILGKEKDWETHYKYLRPFFHDSRYIKKDNCPLFIILHYSSEIGKMCQYWNKLAQNDGFDGMFFVFETTKSNKIPLSEYVFKYEPAYASWGNENFYIRGYRELAKIMGLKNESIRYSYDDVWNRLLKNALKMPQPNVLHGCFASFDDSPRRGNKYRMIVGATPQKFKKYLSKLIEINESQKKEFIFIVAWNEWGEGAYLEPDTDNGYAYLDIIKKLTNNNQN